jgi:hypothetical protein
MLSVITLIAVEIIDIDNELINTFYQEHGIFK